MIDESVQKVITGPMLVFGVVGVYIVIAVFFMLYIRPSLRSYLFKSSIFSTVVNGELLQADIIGKPRPQGTGMKSLNPKEIEYFDYYLIVKYEYEGKKYRVFLSGIYNRYFKIPGIEYTHSLDSDLRNRIQCLRQLSSNTAFTFKQEPESNMDGTLAQKIILEFSPGEHGAAIKIPVLKWMPGWNLYNMNIAYPSAKDYLAFLVPILVLLFIPACFLLINIKYFHRSLGQILMAHYQAGLIGAAAVILFMVWFASLTGSMYKPSEYRSTIESLPSPNDQ